MRLAAELDATLTKSNLRDRLMAAHSSQICNSCDKHSVGNA